MGKIKPVDFEKNECECRDILKLLALFENLEYKDFGARIKINDFFIEWSYRGKIFVLRHR